MIQEHFFNHIMNYRTFGSTILLPSLKSLRSALVNRNRKQQKKILKNYLTELN